MQTGHIAKSGRNRSLISQRVRGVSPSGIRKFFDILASMEGVISLGVGEPDFVTPWNIREAAISSVEKGYTHYTSNYGLLELREEVARYLKRLYGVEYDPKTEILITVGVSEGLDLAMRALVDPGDEVLIPDPSYVAYSPLATLAGAAVVPVPTTLENNFKLMPHDLESKISGRSKAIIMGYPCNPTGAVMSRDELQKVADLALEHGLIIASDEIYARLVYGIEHTCVASLPGMRDSTVLLGGFSKAFAMTGWRIGYAAATEEIIEAMMKVHQYTLMCAPITGQMAALEALRSKDALVDEMLEEYDRRRKVIVRGLNEMGLTCFEPQGAFYAFPSIKITGLTSDEFAQQLLEEEKVAVVAGSAFGQYGEGHVRCCYATSMSDLQEAVERIGRFVKRHKV
ncbi:MAG: aminotransferase class I/II-fold pyridoxal phosphate-dependent enzyme [Dehalococcoidia bacterium]|nr:aminotransferase class I/II-fold pyridoxal phosphate-dependent enzyme [Dehalococcoidia bacterium]